MNDNNMHEISNRIESLETKINKFSEILQKFGLDLIQTIGGLKHELSVLTSKTESIEKSLIEIKGIKTQIHETFKIQRLWEKEISEIKTSISSLNEKYGSNINLEPEQSQHIGANETPLDILNQFAENIETANTAIHLQNAIKKTKERIFILTGGHKILLELRAYEQNAMKNSNLNVQSFKDTILKKIKEWKTNF